MLALNTIHKLDCVQAMQQLEAGSVDLVFADPPFNIGYKYDVYEDKKDAPSYLSWSKEWISGVHRALKPNGTFWLAIGDDYAAELKLLSQQVGFHCRSWVIWYYTFGVNCKYKFSRSHTHIFHFVKDKKTNTFNREAILVPSARQMVYADKRGAKEGRLPDDTWVLNNLDVADGFIPDDTWVLRPQNLVEGFQPDDSTWYFPRVAGTFKEREGFHGCQMPEQLLGRIIKVSSNPGDLVLDPFSGSATTVAVAKKLGRQFVAFDISDEYIERGMNRICVIEPGDPLDGAEDPKVSAPATGANRQVERKKMAPANLPVMKPSRSRTVKKEDADAGLIEAFRRCSQGYSVDRVVADPELDAAFLDNCKSLGLSDAPSALNKRLLRIRKSGRLAGVVDTTRRTEFSWSDVDPYLFASEIAWNQVAMSTGMSLDDIFCDPLQARKFDEIAHQFAPGYSPLEYRMAAFRLRKTAKTIDSRADQIPSIRWRLSTEIQIESIRPEKHPNEPSLYVVKNADGPLYVGETLDLRRWMESQRERDNPGKEWMGTLNEVTLTTIPHTKLKKCKPDLNASAKAIWLMAYQLQLVRKFTTGKDHRIPPLNVLGRSDSKEQVS